MNYISPTGGKSGRAGGDAASTESPNSVVEGGSERVVTSTLHASPLKNLRPKIVPKIALDR